MKLHLSKNEISGPVNDAQKSNSNLEQYWSIVESGLDNMDIHPRLVHVIYHGEGWAVLKDGANRVSAVLNKYAEAVERGKELFLNGDFDSLVVHNRDGGVTYSINKLSKGLQPGRSSK